jgi:glucosamine--fructose-6-phosphate aminotransferase (isomerizing)
MCGIVACQTTAPALGFLLPALRRLEYRGYDSAGVAVSTGAGHVVRLRAVGRLAALEQLVDNHHGPTLDGVGIGHTRWATHGGVTETNAHPHTDCTGALQIVHNGIIENADELRAELAVRGHRFASEVDSETIAHLVEEELHRTDELVRAVRRAVARLDGSWALAVLRQGERAVVVTANHSPLVVAHGPYGALAASDMTALAGFADDVRVLADGDVAELRSGGIRWHRRDGSREAPTPVTGRWSAGDVALAGAPDYMAKEIAEQAGAAASILDRFSGGIVDGRLWTTLGLPALDRVRFLACGTSLNAAAVLARVLARSGVPATLAPASEIDDVVLEPGTLTVALSQSGETADVLRALDRNHERAPVLALTNAPHSTLARAADAVVDLDCGPEIGVAATKTFTAQVVAGTAVLLSGLVHGGRLDHAPAAASAVELAAVPEQLAEAHLTAAATVPAAVEELVDASGFLFIGRGAAVPYAAEGCLKLKEITYRWAECQPAGELKHGPIALLERGTPVVVVDDGHPKLAGNTAEVRARGAHVVTVGGPGSTLPYRTGGPTTAPWGPVAAAVLLQHLAREVGVRLGRDVDKPRNLAKSVTVE